MGTQAQPQFTPGPWAVGFADGSGAGDDGFTITAGDHPARTDRNIACPVRSGRDSWGVVLGIDNAANARLIAAAPELYEALEACVFALGRTGANVAGGSNRKEWEQARAALAKATQA